MRILFPTLAPFPSDEAPAVQVANMAQAFAELGHAVTLLAPTGNGGPPQDDRVERHELSQRYGFIPDFTAVRLSRRSHRGQSYLHAARIALLSLRTAPDLLFSRNLRGCLLPSMMGIPTVFEAHTLTSLEGRQDRWVLERLARTPGFRGIVAISQGLADDLVRIMGIDRDRIHVAHDAVRISAEDSTGATSRRSSASLRVGYTGSLFPGRGIELLLDAARRCPWIELHLVGGPAQQAADIAAQRPDGPRGNIVVHGPVSPVEARRLQRGFDVLVAPFAHAVHTDSGVDSARWMSPMKVFEYMASGRPIVISDLPVLREVLRPEVDALMVEPERVEALLTALERLRDDPALGERLAASALERVRTEFTWEIRARRILERFCA